LGPYGCPTRRASGRRAIQTRGPESGFAPVHEPPLVSPLPDGGLGAAETEEEAGAPDVYGLGGARLQLVSRPSSHRGERVDRPPCPHRRFLYDRGARDADDPVFPVHLHRSPHLRSHRTADRVVRQQSARPGAQTEVRQDNRWKRRKVAKTLPILRHEERSDGNVLLELRCPIPLDEVRDKGLSARPDSRLRGGTVL